ncbi:M56 family metallopeptidase [Aquimarina muelleri]|uniref:M56 family metallopeptidase n=1 Tax=Aquimarina muelleri TaxID=279356 RepID=UPI003F683D76
MIVYYVLKSSMCIALLWGFYTLFLEQENMHHFKRFYLIFSLVFSYTIPLLTFTYTTNVVDLQENLQQPVTYVIQAKEIPSQESSINYLSTILWIIYGIGALIFAIRFIKNILNLIEKVRVNENLKEPSHTNVLLENPVIPYTFLKYIFVSKKEFQAQAIPKEVFLHEKTHVQQKHTLDILFVEVLQVVFWCNPMWFWIKKSIRLNHEFLADQTVLKQQFSIHQYINLLVNYPNSTNHTVLTSAINYSLTKKRIVMMSKQFSKTRVAARLLLLLPILFICMLLFNNKIVAQQKNINYTKTVSSTDPDKKIKIRIKEEKITVNGTATNLQGFATTVDELTKQWKDNELTEFQFDVQIMNSEDNFVQQLNQVYRNTRLYKVNPDGHDLIPPPPSLPYPSAPKAKKEKKSILPLLSPKVKKEEQSDIPMLSTPPKPPSNLSQSEIDEIENEIEQAIIEAEQARVETEIDEATIEKTAMEAIAEAQMEAAEIRAMARIEVQKARKIAIEAAQKAREEGMRRAEKSREMARVYAGKARKHAEKVREKAMKKARKARDEVRKEAEKARKEARKVIEEARKEAEKSRNSK